MKHILSGILCLIIIISLPLTTYADAGNEFSFRSGVKWDMDVTQVKKVETLTPMFEEAICPFTLLGYRATVGSYDNVELMYYFRNNKMDWISYSFYFDAIDAKAKDYLNETLTEHYGKPETLDGQKLSTLTGLLDDFNALGGAIDPAADNNLTLSDYGVKEGTQAWTYEDGTTIFWFDGGRVMQNDRLYDNVMVIYVSPMLIKNNSDSL